MYSKGTMCSDSMVSTNSTMDFSVKKITKTDEGYLVGGAGTLAEVSKILDIFEENPYDKISGKAEELASIENSEALVVNPDGDVFMFFDKYFFEITPTPDFICIGSGKDVANGVMEMGGTPEKAVEIACKYVHGCGGKLQKVELD